LKRKLNDVDGVAADDGENEEIIDECETLAMDVLEDLAKVRENTNADSVIDHFRVGPLGGNWTMRHLGVLFDAYKGWAHGADVCAFCEKYGLIKSARFNVSLYGDMGSVSMAKQWCHRMNWLYMVWVTEGSPRPFQFTDVVLAAYQEPAEFTACALGLVNARALQRVVQMRALRPLGTGT
jgi:hypothetical protein